MNSIIDARKFICTSLVLVISLIISCSTSINYEEKNKLVVSAFLKGPYVQKLRQTEITIVWESDSSNPGVVYYGKDDNLNLNVKTTEQADVQKVTLKNLEPENTYSYQVEVNGEKSELRKFRTAVKEGSKFTFAAYGDNKNGPFNHKKISDLILSYNPLFVANNGDLVERGSVYKQWEKLFFTPTSEMIASIPLIPAIGNHEDNSEYYYNYFCLPNNKAWHSFDLNGAHFLVVNTEKEFLDPNGEQITWLINDLKNNKSTWTFAFQHIPLFTSGGNYYSRDRINVKNMLHPIYEKFKVDLVIAGHDHHYERSKPIGSKQGNHAITYIVGGNGGTPMRYIGKPKEFSLNSRRTFGFALIEISVSKLTFKEISIDNELIDQFSLDKQDSNSMNKYLENKILFEEIHDPVLASKLYSKGKEEFNIENYNGSIKFLTGAYDIDNNCEEATVMLAEAYLELGDYKNARKFAEKTIDIASLHPDSYSVIGKIYENEGKYEEAITWYEKQFNVSPDTPNALEDIALIYEKMNRIDLVEAILVKAISILPNDANLYFRLAEFYEKNDRYEEALNQYKLGIEWFYDEDPSEVYLKALEKVNIGKIN